MMDSALHDDVKLQLFLTLLTAEYDPLTPAVNLDAVNLVRESRDI